MKKISVCTVSMNRVFHVRETLLKNINNTIHLPNIEFILLDYNSSDGLENWVEQEMMTHIQSGLLKYVKTLEPIHFDRSHSRNLAVNIASGDIIALVDADNYLGENYIDWIRELFDSTEQNIIVTTIRKNGAWYGDQAGKCAFYKEKFNQIRGFDEKMSGYGFEDIDLINRLDPEGVNRVYITEPFHLEFIGHSYFERINNEYMLNNIESIYVSESKSKINSKCILYLMADGSFTEAFFFYNEETANSLFHSYFGYEMKDSDVTKGHYSWHRDGLHLEINESNSKVVYHFLDSIRQNLANTDSSSPWIKLDDNLNTYISNVMMFSECWNRLRFKTNWKNADLVNPNSWGNGTVFVNFSDFASKV